MKLTKKAPRAPLGKRVDELHRAPTRFERFRAWIEGVPKVRLFVALIAITWLSLTVLIGVGSRPPMERIISQGIIGQDDISQLESQDLIQQSDFWSVLVGVGLVVAAEMGVAWYFLERFGRRILKSKATIKLVLAASLK